MIPKSENVKLLSVIFLSFALLWLNNGLPRQIFTRVSLLKLLNQFNKPNLARPWGTTKISNSSHQFYYSFYSFPPFFIELSEKKLKLNNSVGVLFQESKPTVTRLCPISKYCVDVHVFKSWGFVLLYYTPRRVLSRLRSQCLSHGFLLDWCFSEVGFSGC